RRAARRHLGREGAVPRLHRFAVDEPGRLLRPLGRRHPRLRVHVLWLARARTPESMKVVAISDRRRTGGGAAPLDWQAATRAALLRARTEAGHWEGRLSTS